MKKNYQKPDMRAVKILHQQHLLAGSGEVADVDSGDTGIGFGGGSSGGAKARGDSGWFDDEEYPPATKRKRSLTY